MIRSYFIKQGIKEAEMEDFIRKSFPLGDYSRTEIVRTPLGTKIIIYTNKQGRIIGRGGKNINDITEAVRTRFNLENPQVDVKTIENPNLDAKIVAKQIASALERGFNVKKIANITVKRVLESGAIGIEIIVSGKFTGSKAMQTKVIEGYLKQSGHPSKTLVDEGFEVANTKPGTIGVKVKIMNMFQDITGEVRKTVKPVPKEKTAELITESLEKGEADELADEADTEKKPKKAAAKPRKKAAPKKKEPTKEESQPKVEDSAEVVQEEVKSE